jgi:hypothetical protein
VWLNGVGIWSEEIVWKMALRHWMTCEQGLAIVVQHMRIQTGDLLVEGGHGLI